MPSNFTFLQSKTEFLSKTTDKTNSL